LRKVLSHMVNRTFSRSPINQADLWPSFINIFLHQNAADMEDGALVLLWEARLSALRKILVEEESIKKEEI